MVCGGHEAVAFREAKVNISCSTVVLAVLLSAFLPTPSQAATKSAAGATKSQTETYKAREKCISEAIAAVPGTPAQENQITRQRTSKYTECAKRMGFRP